MSEDSSPFIPISTYGASKLAGEALISSYAFMFDLKGHVFRFGNVIGPRQTHGVGYDFLRRLNKQPDRLDILGDGNQSKPYIHVDDVYSAVMAVLDKEPSSFRAFNVATPDLLTVKEIADLAVQTIGLKDVQYIFSGGDRGWKGDVPIVKLNCERIYSLGWMSRRNAKQAMQAALALLWSDIKAGKIQ